MGQIAIIIIITTTTITSTNIATLAEALSSISRTHTEEEENQLAQLVLPPQIKTLLYTQCPHLSVAEPLAFSHSI